MPMFRIEVSKEAEPVAFDALPPEEQEAICRNLAYDEALHAIYQVMIMPRFLLDRQRKKRLRRRKAYNRVNLVLVQIETPSDGIRILGMYPLSQEHKPVAAHLPKEFPLPIVRMRLRGPAKDAARRGDHSVLAWRTDTIAQWVFLEPYLASAAEFCLKVLLVVDDDLPSEDRFVRCSVSFQEDGRVIEEVRNRRVEIPDEA